MAELLKAVFPAGHRELEWPCLEVQTLLCCRAQPQEGEGRAGLCPCPGAQPGSALHNPELRQQLESAPGENGQTGAVTSISSSSPAPERSTGTLHSDMNVHLIMAGSESIGSMKNGGFYVRFRNTSLISIPESQFSIFHSGQGTKALHNSQASF